MIVVDSDLVSVWVFGHSSPYRTSKGSPPPSYMSILKEFDRPLLPFVCVRDLLILQRFVGEEIDDPELKADYLSESEAKLREWFNGALEVVYPTTTNARSWTQIACDPALPEDATDAHVWVAVIVQSLLTKFPSEVFLGALETRVYRNMASKGFLPPGVVNPWEL